MRMKPIFVYSDELMGYDMGPQHPLRPIRLRMTNELLEAYGLFEQTLQRVEPIHAEREDLEALHSPAYLDMLERLDEGEQIRGMQQYGFGGGDNPIFKGLARSSSLYAGASIQAAQAVVEGASVAFSLSGGLHHAHYARAAGFCVLNDCGLAVQRLRKKFARVAYVDIDVHHGDGVQELFYDDPNVLTVSLHEGGQTLFPGTGFVNEIGEGAGIGFSVNLPFAPYTNDEIWISSFREGVLPILRAFDPEAVVLQMGADPHYSDPLAHVSLTTQGWLQGVIEVRKLGKPIVAIGGGGYNLENVTRMWTMAVATLCDATLPDEIPKNYSFADQIPPTLNDHAMIDLGEKRTESARLFAAQSVAEIKSILFSTHRI